MGLLVSPGGLALLYELGSGLGFLQGIESFTFMDR